MEEEERSLISDLIPTHNQRSYEAHPKRSPPPPPPDSLSRGLGA